MTYLTTARKDTTLNARVARSTPLYYDDDPQASVDLPPYVRAASSLALFADRIAVVADDANFIALIDPATRRAGCIPLPAGRGGEREFDDEHGNKRWKLDLEACVTVPDAAGQMLVAFGSGSKPEREWVVVVPGRGEAESGLNVYEARALYAALRDERAFAGSELNVEGAVFLGDDTLRLFQRGNGEPHDGVQPVDATCDLQWSALWAHIQAPEGAAPPALQNIVQYELGELDGVRLSFSDAEAVAGVILYSASAEATSGGSGDGRVAGSVLGVIDPTGAARWAELIDEDGSAFGGKVEGLSAGHDNPNRLYFVTDMDDPDEPSKLYEVDLSGPWYEGRHIE